MGSQRVRHDLATEQQPDPLVYGENLNLLFARQRIEVGSLKPLSRLWAIKVSPKCFQHVECCSRKINDAF